jgi:hypothetical protein
MVGLVTNLANCNSLSADSCVGGDQYRWEQTPDICRKPVWNHSSRFFAYSDDGMYSIFRVDSEHRSLLLRQNIPFLRGKAICSDYYCGKDGVEHFAFSEMGGPIRRFRAYGAGDFCEMWTRDLTAGHAVDLLLSHAEGSSPSEGVTTTALIYHFGNSGFSIERYTEENELVKARMFPNEGTPAASQLFNSGDSLLVSPMKYFGIWH